MGLFNSTILEVVIGIVFVYLLLSILCTSANEWVAAMTRRRGEMLRKGIRQLLENQKVRDGDDTNAFLEEFYKHPLIACLKHDKNHPAYIAPRTFVAVITDLLTVAKPGTVEFADFENGAKALPDGNVKKSLLALIQRSNQNFERTQLSIEAWFNDAMDRVNGWYKRRTQMWTIIIALFLTLIANANTIEIVRKFSRDPVLRSAVVEEAKVRAQKPRPTISVEYKNEDDPTNPTITRNEGNELSQKEMDLLGQTLGWHDNVFHDATGKAWPWRTWLERLIGWLLTLLAISLGAPFWFDILNKIVNIRFAGKSPVEESKGPEKPRSKPVA
ncbi:MAG TPA: hypothetical protein VKB05_01775 [Pyrinomonadaceae bacterium]|nr:hypothetical protein [Pyrinomonadaceae bacterium]